MTYLKSKRPRIGRMKAEAALYHWIKEINLALCRKLQGMLRENHSGRAFLWILFHAVAYLVFSVFPLECWKNSSQKEKKKNKKTTLSWHFYWSTETRYTNQTNEKKAHLSPRTPEAKKKIKTLEDRNYQEVLYNIPVNDINGSIFGADANN